MFWYQKIFLKTNHIIAMNRKKQRCSCLKRVLKGFKKKKKRTEKVNRNINSLLACPTFLSHVMGAILSRDMQAKNTDIEISTNNRH